MDKLNKFNLKRKDRLKESSFPIFLLVILLLFGNSVFTNDEILLFGTILITVSILYYLFLSYRTRYFIKDENFIVKKLYNTRNFSWKDIKKLKQINSVFGQEIGILLETKQGNKVRISNNVSNYSSLKDRLLNKTEIKRYKNVVFYQIKSSLRKFVFYILACIFMVKIGIVNINLWMFISGFIVGIVARLYHIKIILSIVQEGKMCNDGGLLHDIIMAVPYLVLSKFTLEFSSAINYIVGILVGVILTIIFSNRLMKKVEDIEIG
ncbi:hypothetical protein U472_09725 [Orenia metallireducens]|uniref:Uncharacterized protein n=1 Tax=Orenia metallireducens TaxID=1413210 RepID=A0A1C0A7T2_9FIRM|nr:hypothetical protein [Orenia metallireducens]OCL26280.1 hypothetical protein U472_09725 [Orenia metallireducens]